MKIIITGGHFSPAFALIQRLQKDNKIVVIGRKYALEGEKNISYEYRICQQFGIDFRAIHTGRLQRVLTIHTIPSFFRTIKGFIESLGILKQEKPDIILTFGGYVALPVALAAATLKIPVILHEQTLRAGLSARIISKFARIVMISFESSREFFSQEKVVVTGNPIRNEILNSSFPLEVPPTEPIIYITGGSTGSHIINISIEKILPILLKNYYIFHQIGASHDYEKLILLKNKLPEALQKKYKVQKFFLPEQVGAILRHSSLVVSRSGINTVSELMALGCVALLIPLQYGKLGEQVENAKFFQKIGLGEYIEQDKATPQLILKTINFMVKNHLEYTRNRSYALKYVTLDAAENITRVLYAAYEGRKRTRTA